MSNLGNSLVLLVVGALIGASIVGYVTTLNPNAAPEVKVTIERIEYEASDSLLRFELLNDVPERSLEGKVVVFQDGNQWVGEVNWYYTGYGDVEVLCESINETRSFRVSYNEDYPEATYLDREIEWKEVVLDRSMVFMETKELTINQVSFAGEGSTIEVYVTNAGTGLVSVSAVKVNGEIMYTFSGETTFAPGSSGTITVSQDWTAGNKYSVSLFASDGTLVASYTETAPT
jgi:archaellum component FlaF (FlaF/FlaG flagellin family)